MIERNADHDIAIAANDCELSVAGCDVDARRRANGSIRLLKTLADPYIKKPGRHELF
jgi:hypothetical protein